ncbi:MAG: hypothetical protein WCK84_03610 [Bacteroidota bacterium]
MNKIINKTKAVRWQHFVIIILMAMVVIGTDGCKSTGKISKKERKAQIENAKQQLQSIINGTSTLSYDEQKRVLGNIMDKNYNDSTINSLIIEAQQKLRTVSAEEWKNMAQKADMIRATLADLLLNKDGKSADELQQELDNIRAQKIDDMEITDLMSQLEKKIQDMRSSTGTGPDLPVKTQLENAFTAIANAAKTGKPAQADATIKKTLQLFSSDNATVLIIISRDGSEVDYDKPTTIKRYLNLIKDTKASKNKIDGIMTDANGKIKGLDLIKK